VGGLLYLAAVGVPDSGGRLDLDVVAQPGTHGIVLWRDHLNQGFGLQQYTLKVGLKAPDLASYQPSGWDAPLIPAPDKSVTPTSGPEPVQLHGDSPSTYLNFALWNQSVTPTTTFWAAAYIDGNKVQETYMTAMAGNDSTVVISYTPVSVTGGRHTVAMVADNREQIDEPDETNNAWASQYSWTPTVLDIGDISRRSTPPARTADWDRVRGDEYLWYNCDGVRTEAFPTNRWSAIGWWGGVVIMPNEDVNMDLRLHLPFTGARDGFQDPLISSSWTRGESDFVLINFRNKL
jgi:hypothetical protein